MTLYSDLGVDQSADTAAIRRAFRKKAKTCHPDAGGKPGEFETISRALRVLADPDLRARYDRTGNADEVQDTRAQRIMQMALQAVLQAIDQAAHAGAVEHMNLIGEASASIARQKREHENKLAQARRNHLTVTKAVSRVKAKKKADGVLLRMLEQHVAMMAETVRTGEAETEVFEAVIKMLAGYEYEFERGGDRRHEMPQFILSAFGPDSSGRMGAF